MNKLLKNIRFLRQLCQYSQRYMADRLDMTQGNYARIEAGTISISDDTLRNIAVVLGYSTEVLIHFNPNSIGKEPVQKGGLQNVVRITDDTEKRIAKLEQRMNDVLSIVINLTQLVSCNCNTNVDH
jgi:transcriptional regulator with XRE-family HTH domain